MIAFLNIMESRRRPWGARRFVESCAGKLGGADGEVERPGYSYGYRRRRSLSGILRIPRGVLHKTTDARGCIFTFLPKRIPCDHG